MPILINPSRVAFVMQEGLDPALGSVVHFSSGEDDCVRVEETLAEVQYALAA